MARFENERMTAIVAVLILAIGMFVPDAIAHAQVKPGDFITAENAEQVKLLVSPGVYYKVQHGMSMKIVPTERVDWPPPYKDATEKYSPQVRLTPDHRNLLGYVAGQPFPLVDSNRYLTSRRHRTPMMDCSSARAAISLISGRLSNVTSRTA